MVERLALSGYSFLDLSPPLEIPPGWPLLSMALSADTLQSATERPTGCNRVRGGARPMNAAPASSGGFQALM